MEPELIPEEVDKRARELARRVMSKPPERQQWPGRGKQKATPTPSGASKPRKRGRAGEAS